MDRKTFLASKIEEILNLHPNLRFRVMDHIIDANDFYSDMIDSFREESPYFWGIITDYMGEYIPIKNSKSTQESCSLYLHVPVLFLDEVMHYLKNDFATRVVANEIKDDISTTLMTMNIPTLFDTQTKDGIDYGIIHIAFSFKSSGVFVFGNAVKVYIDGVEVVPFDGRQIEQIKQNSIDHYEGAKTSVATTIENVVKHTLVFYYENKEPFNKLLKEIVTGVQNVIYEIKYQFPASDILETYDVILDSGSISFPLGQFMVLTCAFFLAGEGIEK